MICILLVLSLLLCACGGGGGSSSSDGTLAPVDTNTPEYKEALANYKGSYKGTVDYYLNAYTKTGVPIQADVGADGKLSNVIISGTSTDTSASTVISSTGTDNNGVLQGQGSFIISGKQVNISYTGNIDVVTGSVSIRYTVSGGLTGNMIVTASRINPVAKATVSPAYIAAAAPNGSFGAITLDGSLSTSSPLVSFDWHFKTRPVGSNATIANPSNIKTSFTPDLPGKYELELTTSASKYSYSSAFTTVNAELIPSVNVGATVQLNGSDLYSGGSNVTYKWSFSSLPSSMTGLQGVYTALLATPAIQAPNSINTSFIPTAPGEYKATLKITDGSQQVQSSVVTVFAKPKYTDNGDGTFTDEFTGRIWQKNATVAYYYEVIDAWSSQYVNICGLLGTGWRMPTSSELAQLIYSDTIPFRLTSTYTPPPNVGAVQYISPNYFSYWASATEAINYSGTYPYNRGPVYGIYGLSELRGIRCVH